MQPDLLSHNRIAILESAHRHGLCDVRVFGSVARGEAGINSDVDLLVDVQKPVREAFGIVRFQREVCDLLQCPVDVVFASGLHPSIRDLVLHEAKPL